MNKGEVFGMVLFIVLLLLISVFGFVKPKLDVCRVYYSEISAYSCFLSSYGLPPVRK